MLLAENIEKAVNVELVKNVLDAGGESNVRAFLERFGHRLEDDLLTNVARLLLSDSAATRTMAANHIAVEICHGADPSNGLVLSSAVLQYLRENWKRLGFSSPDLLLASFASALNACVYVHYLEGRTNGCLVPVEETRREVPFLIESPVFWNAASICGIVLLRNNQVAAANGLLADIPFTKHLQAPQYEQFRMQLDDFERKRYEVEERLPTEQQARAKWDTTFAAGMEILRNLREHSASTSPAARVGRDLKELERLEGKLKTQWELSRQERLPFRERYELLTAEQRLWYEDMTRFVNPRGDWNHVNRDWVARTLNDASVVHASPGSSTVSIEQLLSDLETAHSWAVDAGDAHSAWMTHWLRLLVLEKFGRDDECSQLMAGLCRDLKLARERVTDIEISSNIANFFPELAARACRIHDQRPDTRVLAEALELRKSRSLLASEADSRLPGVDLFFGPEALGPRTHYLGYTVLEHDNRIQALLYTADGELSTERIDVPAQALRQRATQLDPRDWPRAVFGKDRRPLQQALAPLLSPLADALAAGRIQVDDHVCIAAEDPINLIPLQYLPIAGRPAVSYFSMSRTASFFDAVLLAREEAVRPAAATFIFVPSKDKDAAIRRNDYDTLTQRFVNRVDDCRRVGGELVTGEGLLACMGPDRLVHIHGHGKFPQGKNPYDESGLLVSDGNGLPAPGSSNRAELLTPGQVHERAPNLKGSHVTLSACVSGLGFEGKGGDVLGMETILRLCGASSILASHWHVRSRCATTVSAEFYRRWLDEGLPRGVAWRQSIDFLMRQESDPVSAAQWCAFSLFGGWR